MMLRTAARLPASWEAMLPQKFSPATIVGRRPPADESPAEAPGEPRPELPQAVRAAAQVRAAASDSEARRASGVRRCMVAPRRIPNTESGSHLCGRRRLA